MSTSVLIDGQKCEKNKIRYITCSSWEDFRSEVTRIRTLKNHESNSETGQRAIFRGHASTEWKLSSNLERAFISPGGMMNGHGNPVKPNFKRKAKAWYVGMQERILERFKLFATGKEGIDLGKSQNELWALGRHYGLLTPFLDWSESPYVAAFFALMDFYGLLEFKFVPTPFFMKTGNMHIWGLRRWKNLEVKDEFEIVSIPRHFGSRLWAQAGVFTKLSCEDHLDIQSYLESRGIAHYLECYVLSHESAVTAITDLKLMNISFSSLFPDLYGAAMEANINELHLASSQLQAQMFAKEKTSKDKK